MPRLSSERGMVGVGNNLLDLGEAWPGREQLIRFGGGMAGVGNN